MVINISKCKKENYWKLRNVSCVLKIEQYVWNRLWKKDLLLKRIIMPLPRWHWCTHLSLYRTIQVCHMINNCLESLLPFLFLVHLTYHLKYLPLKINSYRKIIFPIRKKKFPIGILELPTRIKELRLKIWFKQNCHRFLKSNRKS